MIRYIISLLVVAISLPLAAQDRKDPFDAYRKATLAAEQSYKTRKKKVLYNNMQEYLAVEKKMQQEYEAYKKKVMGMWGDDEMVDSTPKTWVDYSDDLQSRSNVDFESGQVEIELLVDVDVDEDEVRSKLENAVEVLIESRDPETGVIIMKDQLHIVKEEVKEVVEEIVPEEKTVMTDEGQKKVVRIRMELAEDHLPKRAEQFKEIVKDCSSRFGLDQPLVYAVIEQESAFNPMARSGAPAYGLMQLVPKSGGRDAFIHVHHRDVIPSAAYLYIPRNNIELGTGYLNLLMTKTFSDIEDPQCRMLCAIAAYNTGAGNVSRAMVGSRSVSAATHKINAMDYDRLYNHLKRNLPHAETRDYIQKVTEKMKKYKK